MFLDDIKLRFSETIKPAFENTLSAATEEP